MDTQSSGAILRILNLVALADGYLSPQEESLMDSLAEQHKLQAKFISWEDSVDDPNKLESLALKIGEDDRLLAMKTAYMVAKVSRHQDEDHYINAEEEEILVKLAKALNLSADDVDSAKREAECDLEKQPNMWQVLYSCFGAQFEWPIFPT